MTATSHDILAGQVKVYRRDGGKHWHCYAFIGGRRFRQTTKEDSLARAKDFAEDWYLTLKAKDRAGEIKAGKTFKQAADRFVAEYDVITLGERNPEYVAQKAMVIRVHLLPFFGRYVLTQITPGLVQDYRVHRMTSRTRKTKDGDEVIVRPARSTLHHEIVTLRQVLKTANRHGWIDYVPDLSAPYKTSGKITHRAWFSPAEYKSLYEATRDRVRNPRHNRGRWVEEAEQLHWPAPSG